ncbi:ABC transporter [Spirochaetia bacterium]|nr:ABC transporter [Spirochaetia bacterium]
MNIILALRNFFKYRELFFQLVSRDIKLKYRRSILGYFWSVLNPLLTMVVLTIVFSSIFARDIKYFSTYLLIGSLLFSFMSGAVSRAIPSVLGNASLLKKIYVPKYIFTLAAVTSEFVTLLFSLGALIVLIAATRTPITVRFILVLIPIMELYIFSIGLGLFMAQATVFFRDIEHLWGVFSTAWMYLSAIFYPVSILPEWLRSIVTQYNPMYFYITMFRSFTVDTIVDIDGMKLVLRGAVTAGLMLFLGLLTFSRNKNKFILYM